MLFLLSIYKIKNDFYIYICSLCIIHIVRQKPKTTDMMRQPRLSLDYFEKQLLPKSFEAITRARANPSPQLILHVNTLSHVLQMIEGFLKPGNTHVSHAYLTTAMQISLHDRLILPFAYGGVLFVLEVVFCSRCYMKHRILDICYHGLSVSLLPATDYNKFVPTVFAESLLDFAIPSVAGPGHGIIYYEKLEKAFPNFPGASINLTSLIPIMKKYGWTAEELHSEKKEIDAKALELATTHCAKVITQIEKHRIEFMGIDCGSSHVVQVERDEHIAGRVQRTVDVGTVHAETHLGE